MQRFQDWESVFSATQNGRIVGFCTLIHTDYYPENRYSPWISSVFVDERCRGRRISLDLIAAAERYARSVGFQTVYIPSELCGLYEKYGYVHIDDLVNYGGDTDHVFRKTIG